MAGLDERRLEEIRRRARLSWHATPRGREITVILGGVALATQWVSAIVCYLLAPSDTAMWTTFALWGVAVVIYGWVYTVLVVLSGGVIGLREEELDERQLAERRNVYALSRRGSAWMLGGATLVVGLLPDGGDSVLRVPAAAAFMFMFAAFVTHLFLPHLVAGRRLRDLPPEEDGD
ncbi:hypothetical protein [Microbispora sp. NPDC049125]|uniref:hypothetical protein n=1 Tax=Microbispora sp. NPDC049125 TaxID=3154929 RepID=UPI003467B3F2